MLVEMKSPAFKEKGEVRPKIEFHPGLNVVLGKEDGENSIGKSSAMLAIDFVFGGNSYLSGDGVSHIGDHTIFFAFEFDGKRHYFACNTGEAEKIHVCDENYDLTGEIWTKPKYVNWLKEKYHMDFEGLSFRESVSVFFRIYGKDNLDERRPLKEYNGQSMQKSIDILVKLFDRNKDISDFNARLEDTKSRLAAFKEARRYRFVPDLVGGKTQYEENLATIESLQYELNNLTEETVAGHTEADIEKSRKKSQLKADVLQAETELQAGERRLKLLRMSLDYGLYPTEADLSELQEFFPQVNLKKIYEVERYHKKLAVILQDQFAAEEESVQKRVDELRNRIQGLQDEINALGYVGNFSKEFLDKHSELKGRIDAIKAQNEAYLTLQELTDEKQRVDALLKDAIQIILRDIEQEINDRMQEMNDSLFVEARKAPKLYLNEYNSYRFETPDDTGTGSNYKGMVLYDLAVLQSTALPAIAHDSLILKNISDVAINGIMRLYVQSAKQIFIAFDKQEAYGEEVQKILEEHRVLKLSDNNCELYGESWNIARPEQNEDEL